MSSPVSVRASTGEPAAFGALANGDFRAYFVTALIAMSADAVEHVISYWMIFERFQSPALAGFAVMSHWGPFLVLGITFGALADRYDCRRITQIAQGIFILVSLSWAVLYLTGTLEEWHAVVLLILHGIAGALWAVSGQLLLHDMVGATQLQSAVRLNATARQLGIFLGAALGGGLLLAVGPANGLFVNCLLFLPVVVWLFRTRFTGHLVEGTTRGSLSPLDAWRTLRDVSRHRVILAMIVLAGTTSLLVGYAYQPLLPQYGAAIPGAQGELGFTVLLTANAAGAVVGGIALEWLHWLRRHGTRAAVLMGIGWAAALIVFAWTRTYAVAVAALFVTGMLNLAFIAVAQTVVQLEAPPERRGRVIGLFSMASLGLRIASGATVGLLGTAIGIHASLGWSAAVALLVCVALFLVVARDRS